MKSGVSIFFQGTLHSAPRISVALLSVMLWADVAMCGAACPTTNEVGGDLLMRLPFPTGGEFRVSQGYCGVSHNGYQVDFAMPSNSVVVAAAAGTVVEVGNNATNCPTGCGDDRLNGGIYVKIRHQGNAKTWWSSYLHLSRRVVEMHDTVHAGQVLGYSGNTGYAAGFHLHFHVRSAASEDINGVRPTPMHGLEVETGATLITNFVENYTYRSVEVTNVAFELAISRAVQIEWQSQDSYSYQIYRSTNMAEWQPVGDRMVGDGGLLSLTAKTDDNRNESFLGEQYLPNPSNRFVNLTDFYLDGATASFQENRMKLQNMRAESAFSTLDDYYEGVFAFDHRKQVFQVESLTHVPNVGVFASPFFAKNVPASVTMSNASGVFAMGVEQALTSTGQIFYASLEVGHVISIWIRLASVPFYLRVIDPTGKETLNYYLPQNPNFTYQTAIVAFKSGPYGVQFGPATGTSMTLALTFLNCNRRILRTIQHGSIINETLASNSWDYAKFKIDLLEGQVLTMPNANVGTTIANSRSRVESTWVGGGITFRASADDTYYIFVYSDDLARVTYSGNVTVSSPAGAAATESILSAPSVVPSSRGGGSGLPITRF